MLKVIKPRVLIEARSRLSYLRLCLRFFENCGLHFKLMLKDRFENPISNGLFIFGGMKEITDLGFFPTQAVFLAYADHARRHTFPL